MAAAIAAAFIASSSMYAGWLCFYGGRLGDFLLAAVILLAAGTIALALIDWPVVTLFKPDVLLPELITLEPAAANLCEFIIALPLPVPEEIYYFDLFCPVIEIPPI